MDGDFTAVQTDNSRFPLANGERKSRINFSYNMALVITEEQQMLKTSAQEFLKDRAPVVALRALRDANDSKGYAPELWGQMAEMGWTALAIPEEYGGLGFGYTGLGQVMEEMGKTLTASPMLSTVLLGASAVQLGGNVMQKEAILPAVAEGKMLLTLAYQEGKHHRPTQITMAATPAGDTYTLSGTKNFVLDGHIAHKFVVAARTSGQAGDRKGISLFLVDANADGVSSERKVMMDSRNAATVTFENATAELLGEADQGFFILNKVLDIGCISLAAEMLGAMQEAFNRTIAYLKERQQFGVPIGVFQGLQHRAAHMFCEIELCKSLVLKSLQAIDSNSKRLPVYASMTKAKVGETLKLVSNEGVQMFGGIGMTDDEEIGFFLKRARVAQQTFGDYNFHLARFARLNGF